MKKILHILGVLEYGGTEAFIMNNYRILDRTKYQFDFMVFRERDYPYLKEIAQLGGRVFFSGRPEPGNMRAFRKRFREIIQEGGPYDAVHVHVNLRNAFPLREAFRCGIPVRVSHAHATNIGKTGGIKTLSTVYKRWLIKKYATVFAACSDMAGEVLYQKAFFHEHGTLVPNGVDVRRFLNVTAQDCAPLRDEWHIPQDCPLVVGNITRFDTNKNGAFAIRVFSHILKSEPKAILVMGGPDGGQLEACKQVAASLGIQDSVRFVGKRNDIPQCLKLIDIYLFPSFTEGLSIALLEVQASGCFCAASSSNTKQTDASLGSLLFISLDKPEAEWAQETLKAYRAWKPAGPETIMERFVASGFEIHEAHKKLLSIYE